MRLTGSRAYTRPTPVPKMPPGLVELMEGLTKEILRNNPENIYEFCANHMENLLLIKEGTPPKKTLTLEQKITKAQQKIRQRINQRQQQYDKDIKLQLNRSFEKEAPHHEIEDTSRQNIPCIPNNLNTLHHELDLVNDSEVEISHEPCVICSNGDGKLYEGEINKLDAENDNNDAQNLEPTAEIVQKEVHKADLSKREGKLAIEDTKASENNEGYNNTIYRSEVDEKLFPTGIENTDGSESNLQISRVTDVATVSSATSPSIQNDVSEVVKRDNSAEYDEKNNITNDIKVEIEKDLRSNEAREVALNNIMTFNSIQNQEDGAIEVRTVETPPNVITNASDQIEGDESVKDESVIPLLSHITNITNVAVAEEIKAISDNGTKNEEQQISEDNQTSFITSNIQEENGPILEMIDAPQKSVDETLLVKEIKNQDANAEHLYDNEENAYSNNIDSNEINDKPNTRKNCLTINVAGSNGDINFTESPNLTNSLVETISEDDKTDDPTSVIIVSDAPNDRNKTLLSPLEINEKSDLPNNENFTIQDLIHQDINESTDNIILPEKCPTEVRTNDISINDDHKVSKIDPRDQNNMDLETAAITIQKVFRSFLFKSRNSTFEDTNDETNSLDEENDKREEYYASADLNKERRPLGITRMDTVLQTVNEEKSLSLSTDDSTISSAATIIQAHVRGFLVRNKLNSNKTISHSLINSNNPSNTSLEEDTDQLKNKTVLNIHIVPEGGNCLSRDESVLTSMDLSLDGSPPSSANLHPLGYDKSERRKLKREDAVQSVSPPSNNSGKLSEDVDSVKEILNENMVEQQTPDNNLLQKTNSTLEDVGSCVTLSNDNAVTNIVEKISDEMPTNHIDMETDVKLKRKKLSKMSSDEMDVVTPFIPSANNSLEDSDKTSKLEHSGELHDIVLPTKVSRAETSVVRGE